MHQLVVVVSRQCTARVDHVMAAERAIRTVVVCSRIGNRSLRLTFPTDSRSTPRDTGNGVLRTGEAAGVSRQLSRWYQLCIAFFTNHE